MAQIWPNSLKLQAQAFPKEKKFPLAVSKSINIQTCQSSASRILSQAKDDLRTQNQRNSVVPERKLIDGEKYLCLLHRMPSF